MPKPIQPGHMPSTVVEHQKDQLYTELCAANRENARMWRFCSNLLNACESGRAPIPANLLDECRRIVETYS